MGKYRNGKLAATMGWITTVDHVRCRRLRHLVHALRRVEVFFERFATTELTRES